MLFLLFEPQFVHLQGCDAFYFILMSILKAVRSITFEPMFLIQSLKHLIQHHSTKLKASSAHATTFGCMFYILGALQIIILGVEFYQNL